MSSSIIWNILFSSGEHSRRGSSQQVMDHGDPRALLVVRIEWTSFRTFCMRHHLQRDRRQESAILAKGLFNPPSLDGDLIEVLGKGGGSAWLEVDYTHAAKLTGIHFRGLVFVVKFELHTQG